jgi:DNA-binding MarR family transcriptional regulator
MLNPMTDIKKQEYELLNEISQDSMVTQASLSKRLDIAVGSVNWYIKRLIKRGYVKVTHLDRTRLQYDLTPEGMSVFTERALQYAKDSLKVYASFRQQAQSVVSKLQAQGITCVRLQGNDEMMDILRLTCIEANILLSDTPCDITLNASGQGYQIFYVK